MAKKATKKAKVEEAVVEEVVEEAVEEKPKKKGKRTKTVEVEVTSMKRDEVEFAKKSKEIKPQIMTPKARQMKEAMKEMPKELLYIPPEGDEIKGHVHINGEVLESLGDPVRFQANGYILWVPRGVPVEVPSVIADIWKSGEALKKEERELIEANKRKVKVLYDNQ